MKSVTIISHLIFKGYVSKKGIPCIKILLVDEYKNSHYMYLSINSEKAYVRKKAKKVFDKFKFMNPTKILLKKNKIANLKKSRLQTGNSKMSLMNVITTGKGWSHRLQVRST